jgi:hypothetical protein
MKFRNVFGAVLGSLTVISAGLAVAGIWGWVDGDTVWQLVSTFLVIGLATMGLSYVADSFFKE